MEENFSTEDRNKKLKLVDTLFLLGGLMETLLVIVRPSDTILYYLFALFILGGLLYYFIVTYEFERRYRSSILYFSATLLSAAFSGLLVFLIVKGIERLASPLVTSIIAIVYYPSVTLLIIIFLVMTPKKKK